MAKDILPADITAGLKTSFIGQKIIYYRRLTSTMDAARREIRRGASEGTVIIAGEQTGGPGKTKAHLAFARREHRLIHHSLSGHGRSYLTLS